MRVSAEQELQDRPDKRSFQPVRERGGSGQQKTGAILLPGPRDLRQGHESALRHDCRRSLEVLLLQAAQLPILKVSASRAPERAEGTS